MTIPADYGEASFIHTGGGIEGEAVVTMGFANTLDQSASDLADNIGTLWIPVVEGCMVEQVTFTSCKVKLGPDSTGDFAEVGFNNIGDQGTDPSAPQVAILVAKITGVGGRHGRGRAFVPGPPDLTDSDTGEWSPAALSQFQGIFDSFLANMASNDTPCVLLHASAPFPNTITGFVVRARTGTQRRRNRR